MSYADRIDDVANAIAGALHLANQTTGEEDTSICDAVATLIEGYGQGGGSGTPTVKFGFNRSDMTDVTSKGTRNTQRVAQDFTNYWDEHKPTSCESGLWVFMSSQLETPATYSIAFFLVHDGSVACYYRKSYNTKDPMIADSQLVAADSTSVWFWSTYQDDTASVTYTGYKFDGTADITYPFLPVGAELIHTDDVVWNLAADTTYNDITPSTTNQIIKAAGAANDWWTTAGDFETYEYKLITLATVDPKYDTDPTIGFFTRFSISTEAIIGLRTMGGTNRVCTCSTTGPIMNYMQSSGAGLSVISNYGIYVYGTTFSVSAPTKLTSAIGCSFPAMYCRMNTTYLSSDCIEHLIADQTTITLKLEVYRYPKSNGVFQKFNNMLEV